MFALPGGGGEGLSSNLLIHTRSHRFAWEKMCQRVRQCHNRNILLKIWLDKKNSKWNIPKKDKTAEQLKFVTFYYKKFMNGLVDAKFMLNVHAHIFVKIKHRYRYSKSKRIVTHIVTGTNEDSCWARDKFSRHANVLEICYNSWSQPRIPCWTLA